MTRPIRNAQDPIQIILSELPGEIERTKEAGGFDSFRDRREVLIYGGGDRIIKAIDPKDTKGLKSHETPRIIAESLGFLSGVITNSTGPKTEAEENNTQLAFNNLNELVDKFKSLPSFDRTQANSLFDTLKDAGLVAVNYQKTGKENPELLESLKNKYESSSRELDRKPNEEDLVKNMPSRKEFLLRKAAKGPYRLEIKNAANNRYAQEPEGDSEPEKVRFNEDVKITKFDKEDLFIGEYTGKLNDQVKAMEEPREKAESNNIEEPKKGLFAKLFAWIVDAITKLFSSEKSSKNVPISKTNDLPIPDQKGDVPVQTSTVINSDLSPELDKISNSLKEQVTAADSSPEEEKKDWSKHVEEKKDWSSKHVEEETKGGGRSIE